MAHAVTIRTRPSQLEEINEFKFTREDLPLSFDTPEFVQQYRLKAWETYQQLPFPKTTDEAWRRTDIRKLNPESFRLPLPEDIDALPEIPDELLEPLASDQHGGQIILTPQETRILVNDDLNSTGVIFTDLIEAEKRYGSILANVMGQIVQPQEGKFASLASAMARNGVLVYVPRGVSVKDPLHSIYWGPGQGKAHLSHVIVWLEEGASLTYVHETASPSEPEGLSSFHAGIVEIHVGPGANLRFVELQSWGEHVWNFTHERARVFRDGNLDWVFAAIGSRLTKNFSNLDLVGEGASGRMSGFYFTDGVQHLDHDTQQNHYAPHTTSDLLFKGALTGKSRSVWQGMIYVAPGAQKTDGYQANRNLILSDQARADSIPGLEIMANDVRCTHGATVGKIDPNEIFYLRSRGIPEKEAKRLIVQGFFDPIMQRIPFEGVQERLRRVIELKMD